MPLELSLFCDESGSDALDSRYYLLTLSKRFDRKFHHPL